MKRYGINSPFLFSFLTFSLISLTALSQSRYQQSKAAVYKKMTSRYIGPKYEAQVKQFYNKSCDSLIKATPTVGSVSMESILSRLFDACVEEIDRRTITRPRITMVNEAFLQTIRVYQKQPVRTVYRNVGVIPTKILGVAFNGMPVGDTIQDYAYIREMVQYPHYIPNRITKRAYPGFTDTLLYFLANKAPETMAKQIEKKDPAFDKLLANCNNRTVKAVAAIPMDVNYNKHVPFAHAIAEGRTTLEEVRGWVMKPSEYYQKFTDEIIYLRKSEDPVHKNFLRYPLMDINARLARNYYINEINELHEKTDPVRFASVQNLSAKELYFIIVGGEDELYTSSFMYLFKLFLKKTEEPGMGPFLESVSYFNFDRFLTILTIYGVENDLIKRLNEAEFARIMKPYFTELAQPQTADVDLIINSMYLAESMQHITDFKEASGILVSHIDGLQKANQQDNLLYRLYGAFKDILNGTDQIMKEEKEHAYEKLPVDRMKVSGKITEACFFYDDEDGASSFNSYLSIFDPAIWSKEDKGNWVLFSSKSGNPMTVYVNKPNTKSGSDLAQQEMMQALKAAGDTVTLFVHRGHSYHLSNSLAMLEPAAQFIFLGSCGGYQNVLKVFGGNPESQIIATRKIGSRLINDPMLKRLHGDILNNKDVDWTEYWAHFGKTFEGNKHTRDLFSGYNPPNRFYGIIFIRSILNL